MAFKAGSPAKLLYMLLPLTLCLCCCPCSLPMLLCGHGLVLLHVVLAADDDSSSGHHVARTGTGQHSPRAEAAKAAAAADRARLGMSMLQAGSAGAGGAAQESYCLVSSTSALWCHLHDMCVSFTWTVARTGSQAVSFVGMFIRSTPNPNLLLKPGSMGCSSSRATSSIEQAHCMLCVNAEWLLACLHAYASLGRFVSTLFSTSAHTVSIVLPG